MTTRINICTSGLQLTIQSTKCINVKCSTDELLQMYVHVYTSAYFLQKSSEMFLEYKMHSDLFSKLCLIRKTLSESYETVLNQLIQVT